MFIKKKQTSVKSFKSKDDLTITLPFWLAECLTGYSVILLIFPYQLSFKFLKKKFFRDKNLNFLKKNKLFYLGTTIVKVFNKKILQKLVQVLASLKLSWILKCMFKEISNENKNKMDCEKLLGLDLTIFHIFSQKNKEINNWKKKNLR